MPVKLLTVHVHIDAKIVKISCKAAQLLYRQNNTSRDDANNTKTKRSASNEMRFSYLRLNFEEILLKNPLLPSLVPPATPLAVLHEGAPAFETCSLTVGVLGGGPL